MKIGKLKNNDLENLILNKFKKTRSEVESAPHVGADCAKLNIGKSCVLSSDPITAAESRIGYLTVHVNCNDAAAAGAEPVGLVVTILAPPDTEAEDLGKIADELSEAAKAANVDIVGGHTEITTAVNHIITSATVIGKPIQGYDGIVHEGDFILMTKQAGLEGTAVLAYDKKEKLGLSQSELITAQEMINSISVVREGMFAARHGAHAMHDITEGGVLGAVWEMAYCAGMGCILDTDAIPVHEVTKKICDKLQINPYKLISSGSMLIACKDGNEMKKGLEGIGIQATVIGRITGSAIIDKYGNEIEPPESDELYKA